MLRSFLGLIVTTIDLKLVNKEISHHACTVSNHYLARQKHDIVVISLCTGFNAAMILVLETVKLAALGKRHIFVDRITNHASNADPTEPIILWLQPHTSVHSLRITHTRKTRNCPGRHNQHLGDEVSTKGAC
jgi:hypothetical protein